MATSRLKYNPSHMPEDELIHSFVVRQRDLAAILETVRENTGVSNQHLLILGPRGMGKTTLVNRAVAEIRRDPELNRLWYPILFDEESYTVTSPGELWYQALSHLADQTKDPELEKARRALQTVSDRTRLRDASLARILEFADAQHKRLLLAFENVDMIFDDQMVEDDGWDVRHTLQNEPRIMVLATSTTRLDSFHDSKKPLYELFREHTLERLDLEECRTVWHLVTGAELPLNQARPIQIFTGGNTRLLTILATFAKDRSFRELMDDLVGLMDENTSYFKHNIEALPKESRKIFVTLADLWSPATSRQVAEQTRGEIRAVSAQLGRLADQGIIEVVRRVDRTQMFQVAERMYNLYYLLRRRGSGRVRAVVEFIIGYYDHDGMQRLLASVADEACGLAVDSRGDHVRAYCELMRRIPDREQRHEALRRAPAQFLEIPDIASFLQSLNPATSSTQHLDETELNLHLASHSDDITSIIQLASILHGRGDSEQASKLAERALSLNGNSVLAAVTLIKTLGHVGMTSSSRVTILRRAIEIANGEAFIILQPALAFALAENDNNEEARAIANEAFDRSPDNAVTAFVIGLTFSAIGESQAAREALAHALDLDPANFRAALALAQLLVDQEHIDEGEACLRRCLELQPREFSLWIALADLLETARFDPAAALRELQKAQQFHPENAELTRRIGKLSLILRQFSSAELAFRRTIEIRRFADLDSSGRGDLLHLVLALLAQNKGDETHSLLQDMVEPIVQPELNLAAALINIHKGELSTARNHLQSVVQSPTNNIYILAGVLSLSLTLADPTSAHKAAEAILEWGPGTRQQHLEFLCHLVISDALVDFYPDVLRWSRELVDAPVPTTQGSLLFARALGLVERWSEAWDPLSAALANAELARKQLRDIVAFISLAAAHGHAASAAPVLAASPSAPHFEPLLVALRRMTGEPTNPPQEVREVADEIFRDIERLREALVIRSSLSQPGPIATHKQHRRNRKRSRSSGR